MEEPVLEVLEELEGALLECSAIVYDLSAGRHQ
jgi:hypothetical protein